MQTLWEVVVKPANVGEMMEFLASQYTPGEICDMLDIESETLVYYLRDPIEEKFDQLVESEFGDDEDVSESEE